jgi:hypothetical protein
VGFEAAFEVSEVIDVIEQSYGNKSSGLDGFNFAFYKKFFGVLKVEIMKLFREFNSFPSYLQVS